MHPGQADGKRPVGTTAAGGCPGLSDPCGRGSVCLQSAHEGSQASRAVEAGHARTDARPGPQQAQA